MLGKVFQIELIDILDKSRSFGLGQEDFDMSKNFIENNEYGVALEWIVDQLYEYDINISQELFDSIDDIGKKMKMNPEKWSFLNELIT